MFSGELVGGGGALILWRDISSHIWKCLVGKRGLEKGDILKPCILAVKEVSGPREWQAQNSPVSRNVSASMLGWKATQTHRSISGAANPRLNPRCQSVSPGVPTSSMSVVAPKLAVQSTTHMPA